MFKEKINQKINFSWRARRPIHSSYAYNILSLLKLAKDGRKDSRLYHLNTRNVSSMKYNHVTSSCSVAPQNRIRKGTQLRTADISDRNQVSVATITSADPKKKCSVLSILFTTLLAFQFITLKGGGAII